MYLRNIKYWTGNREFAKYMRMLSTLDDYFEFFFNLILLQKQIKTKPKNPLQNQKTKPTMFW